MKHEDIETIRDALEYAFDRVDGCAFPDCHVCKRNRAMKEAALAAVDRLHATITKAQAYEIARRCALSGGRHYWAEPEFESAWAAVTKEKT